MEDGSIKLQFTRFTKDADATRSKAIRLGSTTVSERVRAAVANVKLEGLRPTAKSVKLTHRVAAGEMSADEAVAVLCRFYGRRS